MLADALWVIAFLLAFATAIKLIQELTGWIRKRWVGQDLIPEVHDEGCFVAKRLVYVFLGPDGPYGYLERDEVVHKLAAKLEGSEDELRELVNAARHAVM